MCHKRLNREIKKLPRQRAAFLYWAFVWVAMTDLATPIDAAAYVDPGTAGMLSQILYVLFYGALGVFLYLLRYIEQYLANARQFLANCLEHVISARSLRLTNLIELAIVLLGNARLFLGRVLRIAR
jgi:hypothetical protein